MTKKDFIQLANLLKQDGRFEHIHYVALSAIPQTMYPGFKQGRWQDYVCGRCGPNGGKLDRR
jgi:hypothetical protein